MQSSDKKLLVEAAIAASNHGLSDQANRLVAMFPELIDDDEDRRICTSLVYFGLDEPERALRELSDCQSDQAKGLRLLFSISGKTRGKKNERICQLLTGDNHVN